MATAAIPQPLGAASPAVIDKGLKKGALGYVSNLVISVASTAPAYSLAATLGFIAAVGGVGLQSPAILIVSFIPMLLIAQAYRYLNRADPDCGTTFAWATRALGPGLGWLGGWAIVVSDVIVMANLAQIAGTYSFLLFRWQSAAASIGAVTAVGVVWIIVMTWICYRGIELSARLQSALLTTEVLTLAAFAVVALIKVYADHPAGSIHFGLSWINPLAIKSTGALVNGVLLGLFIYWGWDSGVTVNEESEDSANGPGKAAVMSTFMLVLIYVIVSIAAQAYAGTGGLIANQSDVLNFLGGKVFPRPLDLLLIVAVLTSASASTQTTILPTARTTLSMARWGAVSKSFGRIHPRFQTPTFSTVLMGVLSVIWFVAIVNLSANVLSDSVTALGFLIAFYYGLTGVACAVYYRRELTRSAKNFVMLGVAPLLGGVMLLGIFVKALFFYGNPDNTSSPGVFGIGVPVVVGVGSLVIGVILMLVSRPIFPEFFARRREVADPALLAEIEAGGARTN
jgi:amino acid transporter